LRCLVSIVRGAAQLEIVNGGWTTVRVRDDVMKFNQARFGASASWSLKSATPAIARPNGTAHRRRDVA
jgi:hypothetical protein